MKVIEDVFATTTDARRTLREISILRQSNHHNISKLVYLMRPPDPDTFYELWFVQEYGGWDLRKILKNSSYIEGTYMYICVYVFICVWIGDN